jgi:excisionase family DNA binding protein
VKPEIYEKARFYSKRKRDVERSMTMDKKKTVYNWDQVPVVINLPFVAVILKANPEVVRRYLASGKLKGFKVGKEWRINKSDLMDFVGVKEETA